MHQLPICKLPFGKLPCSETLVTCDFLGVAREACHDAICLAVVDLAGVILTSGVHQILLPELQIQCQDAALQIRCASPWAKLTARRQVCPHPMLFNI